MLRTYDAEDVRLWVKCRKGRLYVTNGRWRRKVRFMRHPNCFEVWFWPLFPLSRMAECAVSPSAFSRLMKRAWADGWTECR